MFIHTDSHPNQPIQSSSSNSTASLKNKHHGSHTNKLSREENKKHNLKNIHTSTQNLNSQIESSFTSLNDTSPTSTLFDIQQNDAVAPESSPQRPKIQRSLGLYIDSMPPRIIDEILYYFPQDEIFTLAKIIDGNNNTIINNALILSIARIKNKTLTTALIHAKSINNNEIKAIALNAIAKAQSKANLLDEARATFELAITTAHSIIDDARKAHAFTGIAAVKEKIGLTHEAKEAFDLAKEAAHSIPYGELKVEALNCIAVAQANLGFPNHASETFDQAITTTHSIMYNQPKASPFNRIAAAQANAGLFEDARETFDLASMASHSITNNLIKIYTLQDIKEAQAQAGRLERKI